MICYHHLWIALMPTFLSSFLILNVCLNVLNLHKCRKTDFNRWFYRFLFYKYVQIIRIWYGELSFMYLRIKKSPITTQTLTFNSIIPTKTNLCLEKEYVFKSWVVLKSLKSLSISKICKSWLSVSEIISGSSCLSEENNYIIRWVVAEGGILFFRDPQTVQIMKERKTYIWLFFYCMINSCEICVLCLRNLKLISDSKQRQIRKRVF